MSRAIASSILRKFSACRSSRVLHGSLPSLVTPSTRNAISWPNTCVSSSIVVEVSSTASCRRPAHTLGTSSLSCEMMYATDSGCVTYGSPDFRVWPSWARAANSYARPTRAISAAG